MTETTSNCPMQKTVNMVDSFSNMFRFVSIPHPPICENLYTGFLFHAFWNLLKTHRNESNLNFGTSVIKSIPAFFRIAHYRWFLIPLLSYVAYFLWYRQQDGFLSLTRFMWDFWSQTFFSNPHDFFIRIYYFFIGNITFVFSHDKTLANL